MRIKPEKWLVPIIEKYSLLERQNQMLEPKKVHHNEGGERVLEGIRTTWQAKTINSKNF